MSENRLILAVDDDRGVLNLLDLKLEKAGYDTILESNGLNAFDRVISEQPDLVLLDINMPEISGYEVCEKLKNNNETSNIPVVYLTGTVSEKDKPKLLKTGAVDFVKKSTSDEILLDTIETHIKTSNTWKSLDNEKIITEDTATPGNFREFKKYLLTDDDLEESQVKSMTLNNLYNQIKEFNIKESLLAEKIADYKNLEHIPIIDPEKAKLGVLPTRFCESNNVIAMEEDDEGVYFVLSNPFNYQLIDSLSSIVNKRVENLDIKIAEPSNIKMLFDQMVNLPTIEKDSSEESETETTPLSHIESEAEENPIVVLTHKILNTAVRERASDIHIEPKKHEYVIRYRIDGVLSEFFTIRKKTGEKLISRIKILSELDISEKRKPQDGGFSVTLDDRVFNIRVATTLATHGESIVIRLLEPNKEAVPLTELGFTESQSELLKKLFNKPNGYLLFVGGTGSGKTTTIYSGLHTIDYESQSVMTVEDPVEYKIQFANQQEVNTKAGRTFDLLLKSSVRQDPDIMYLGEIRDEESAKISMDFASTGHLTISTLHTNNSASTIMRLERLGLDRKLMSDTLIGIVAQKLLRKLCENCKEEVSVTEKQKKYLSNFTSDIPDTVSSPVGCSKCNNSGYHGREIVAEIMETDREISKIIREGKSTNDIRAFQREKGEYMMVDHALEKLKNGKFSFKSVKKKILSGEKKSKAKSSHSEEKPDNVYKFNKKNEEIENKEERQPEILIVEDNIETANYIKPKIKSLGYGCKLCENGGEALLEVGLHKYDLILSDIDMPVMDGFEFLEVLKKYEIDIPVIFLSGNLHEDDEEKKLEMDATDYIQKPFKDEMLKFRIENAVNSA